MMNLKITVEQIEFPLCTTLISFRGMEIGCVEYEISQHDLNLVFLSFPVAFHFYY